jgi:flap endonuclease-1
VVASIEKDSKKRYTIPEDWPYKEARELFLNPDVREADHEECNFTWDAPDMEGLVSFLVGEKGFNEDRVRSAAQKLQKNLKTAQQARLEGFFKPMEKTEEQKESLKRKHEEKLAEQKRKKKDNEKAKKEAKAKPKMNT